MVSLEEVEKTILDLESRDTTFAVCERLAWLYTVRDHLIKPLNTSCGCEFAQCCEGKDHAQVWEIISSHMEELKVICPKEYDSIVSKVKSL